MYHRATFSLKKLPQTSRVSQMSSASLFFFILDVSVIFLNEDCRRHYQEIDIPGQQLSSGRAGRIVPRARRRKLLTQSPEGYGYTPTKCSYEHLNVIITVNATIPQL